MSFSGLQVWYNISNHNSNVYIFSKAGLLACSSCQYHGIFAVASIFSICHDFFYLLLNFYAKFPKLLTSSQCSVYNYGIVAIQGPLLITIQNSIYQKSECHRVKLKVIKQTLVSFKSMWCLWFLINTIFLILNSQIKSN